MKFGNISQKAFYIFQERTPERNGGSISGQKYELTIRNKLIYKDFQNGKTVVELSKQHYLSESSIYRILTNYN
ncbi:Mor transcription activator family protein [Anaeromicropila herbilytica]|uniref:Mor transcription activator family protein n=1 Tax=Anaeromicropila herbilytica TaxID=2785025 RepID=UPI00232A129C|nr:Mor transcription activator family protein [Anaeromicropila herbilytica]